MNFIHPVRISLAFVLAAGVAAAQANPLAALASGAEEGSVKFNLRYRYEHVEQDNALRDADASTLRARLTATTRETDGWQGLLEIDFVVPFGPENYNSTSNGNTTYSVVPDPIGGEINQALIGYRFDAANRVVMGRQRILHGNQRFVGGVGWRQNEQTYDAFSYNYERGDWKLAYAYLWQVNRIFGGKNPSVQAETFQSDSHAIMLTWKGLKAYGYALDFDNAPAASSLTYGLEYAATLGPVKLELALAQQSDYGASALDYRALYYRLDGSAPLGPVRLSLGYEVLGSDNGLAAFSTPLATLHAFQGWADVFLPSATANGLPAGVRDLYIGLSGKLGKVDLAGYLHDYQSDEGSLDYGREFDLVATLPLNDQFSAQFKYADYRADGFSVDTRKAWLMLTYSF